MITFNPCILVYCLKGHQPTELYKIRFGVDITIYHFSIYIYTSNLGFVFFVFGLHVYQFMYKIQPKWNWIKWATLSHTKI